MPTDVRGRHTKVDRQCTRCRRLYGRRVAERVDHVCVICDGLIGDYVPFDQRKAAR